MPERLGHYELMRRLARGGMGEVFVARQMGPGGFVREVVVKRLLPHLSENASFVEQFLNEGRLAGLVQHPNVVQVFELGEDRGTYFLAMERVRGQSLRGVLRHQASLGHRVPVGQAVALALQALDGLQAAHGLMVDGKPLPIVHRDVSPENLLLSEHGQLKVVDFGLARARTSVAFTKTGVVRGKLPYLAPDLLQGAKADAGSDVYALAVVLYELFTGAPPFDAETEGALMYKVLYEAPRPPAQLREEVPAALEAVLVRALEKAPERRYGTATELASALRAACGPLLSQVQVAELGRLVEPAVGDVAEGAEHHPTLSTDAPLGAAAAPRGTEDLAGPASPPSHVGGGTVDLLPLPPAPERARRSPWTLAAVGFGLTATALGLGFWWVQREPAPVVVPAAPVEPPLPVAAAPGGGDASPEPAVLPAPAAPEVVAEPAVEERRPEAPRRKVAEKGRLQVFAKPWADVYWRGVKLGVTPLVNPVAMPAGAQVLTLKNDQLGVSREFRVKIAAGATTELRANLLER
ncbi:MAG: serine/threonine protein kinase [Myxococcaceae bacterium]|nr:serine/threonine protein kinase [Myxococcaceae bacterium]